MMLSRGAQEKLHGVWRDSQRGKLGIATGGRPHQDAGRHGSGISGKKRRPKEGGESCTER